MDDCSHGQQPHKCETCEVTAERDRLRADLAVEQQNARVLEGYFDEAIEKAVTAEAERDRLRAVVEIADRAVDRRDPEQWSVNHDAFADLGAALDALDVSGPMGGDDA